MRPSSLLLCAGLITLGAFAACGSDDGTKKNQDGEAGAGAADSGSGGDVNSAGSNSPAGGEGGVPGAAGQGGSAPVAMGGEGGAIEGGTGGVPVGGEGGMGGVPLNCPAQPTTVQHSCGEITELFGPSLDLETGELSLNIASLEYPIVSGSITYFDQNGDDIVCATSTDVSGEGNDVTAQLVLRAGATYVRISAVDLVDGCGDRHVFDPNGVPACNELIASGGNGSTSLNCATSFPSTCPAACNTL